MREIVSKAARDLPVSPIQSAPQDLIEAQGTLDAVGLLMAAINHPDVNWKDKIQAAAILLPYQRPKLAEVGARAQKAAAAEVAATGRFAAPAPPPGRIRLNA